MRLNFKSFGQGPALIILHGLFGSLDNWVSHARILAENHSVYLLDQRNHGKSPHDPEWDYPTMAEDLHDFMDQQGIFQADLIGHSMGGKVVMQFALEYPSRVNRLIVADMAPKSYPPHHTQILETIRSVDLGSLNSRKEADAKLAEGIDELSVRQFLLKGLGRNEEKQFAWKFNFPVIYERYPKILENLEVDDEFDGPTLFLYGGASHYVTPEDFEDILEKFPQAEFIEMPGIGHWLHAQAPKAFLEHVGKFLA
ncbi:alpha/beta fold hydrolase [Pontibacter sp. G13]|uniref:alpha/beta fold hydrolase n=1 Tax=Pontibacter sp. G13 TaxID=3074898 RepID=UPI00288A5F79|nr:alpha/beta fold hydrolase [Pontibacter sp. G13]WNJ18832.1 alpha/beta fold hydrolase [Pontibacter sp. G13]